MRLGYVVQRLGLAVSGMATHTGTLQSRLADAVRYDFLQFKAEDFPAHLQADFEFLMRETKKVADIGGVGTEGPIVASTRTMSDAKAKEFIEKIVVLFKEVVEAMPKEN